MTATLRGQTAVITGAGSAEGIGFAIARRLVVDAIRRGRREVLTADGEPDAGASGAASAYEWVQAAELAAGFRGKYET